MTEAIAEVLAIYGLIAMAVLILVMVVLNVFDGSSADRERDKLAKRISKEYKNRPRMKAVRFWNF